jgi:anhydro-N-acetylmuramic acid kinase
MQTRWLIGLSSGSTVDGVDAALLEAQGAGLDLRLRLVHSAHHPYPRDLRELVRRLSTGAPAPVRHASLAHRLLGEAFAAAAQLVADGASFSLQNVQCLGCPGHPAWHEPDARLPSCLGLGMAAVVAERTGVTTVSDFAARDVAVGGQGAPLTALIDHLLFRDPVESRVLVHLGGMAALVWLPAGGQARDVLGFQAGPCNLLLDDLMRQLTGGRESYDAGGKHAVQGRCLEPLLRRWLAHPALQRRPPRSLRPGEFGEEFVRQAVEQAREQNWSLHDLLCTATHLVARGVTEAVRRFLPAPPARALLSGGGVRNGLLLHLLEQNLPGTPLERIDRHGIPATARKAVTHGALAALTVDGVPASLPSATGAAGSRLLGNLTPGSSANWARCLAWMASQTAHLRGVAPSLTYAPD